MNNVIHFARKSKLALLSGAMLLLGSHGARAGIVISGASDAYAVSADLRLRLVAGTSVTAFVSPVALAEGTAPPTYNDTAQLASLSLSAEQRGLFSGSSVLDVSTGILTSNATSNVDGFPGVRTTSADNTINGLSAGLVTTALSSLLNISATTIQSTSQVTGDYDSLSGIGSTTFEDLRISLEALNFSISLSGAVGVAPNTVVATNLLGLTILLNEQIQTGDGISSRGFETNAIVVRFENFVLDGIATLNGELIIGHSEAFQAAVPDAQPVPEPSTLVTLSLKQARFGPCI